MTTPKKNLTEYAEAMGFEAPAGATEKHVVEGELMPDYEEAEFTDIPEHSTDDLPVHKRSLPKVALSIAAVSILFGLPAYFFLSAASGGGGSTNVVKVDNKDNKGGLRDPQTDEINKLKTDLAVGKQLASAPPSSSPSTASDDKATPTTTPPPVAATVPAVTKANPPAVVAPPPVVKPEPKPVVAPVIQAKPFTPVVAKPIPITPPPAVVKPEAKPAPPVVAKAVVPVTPPVAVVKALPPVVAKAIEPTPKPAPVVPIAKAPVVVATNPTPPTTPLSWEQASAAGVYGGETSSIMPPAVGGLGVAPGVKDAGKDGTKQQNNYDGAMSPTLLLPAGTKAKGRTLAPYAVGISKNQSDAMPLSIALDESIELGKGYHLPVGTTVNFIASVRDNGSVVAVSKNADIGGVEIQLPEGAISLASDNNGLLMAKEISTGDGDLARADTNSSIWGGIAGAGKAILQTGGQTTTNTGLLGTTTTQTNNGSPNIIGGVLDGAFTPLATNGVKRAEQKAEEIEKRSKLNTIDVGTKVKLFVNVPVQVQIPVSGQQVGQATEEEELPPPRLITSNSIQSTASNEELPPPVQKSQSSAVLPQTAVEPPLSTQSIVTQQPATTAVIQSPLPLPPSVVPQPLPSELPRSTQTSVVPPLVKSQSPTTPLPLYPSKTRISRPW